MAMVPTKGNLIIAKNTLKLSKTGYELLDKKRNILIREMMSLIETAKGLQSRIETTYQTAYLALRTANMEIGIETVEKIARAVDEENSLQVKFRSVMGVEIPIVTMEEEKRIPVYGFMNTTASLDVARQKFLEVKELTRVLSQVENSVYCLAIAIKKTQKRANALKNIMIPRYEEETKNIQNALEEKEREEFSRLKVIKAQKSKGQPYN